MLNEWLNRILEPRWLKWIPISIVAVFLAGGLWPLDFSPKNQVEWLMGEKGLHFRGESVIPGKTVGGYAWSTVHLGIALPRSFEHPGLCIEMWLRSADHEIADVLNILSFVNDVGKVTFVLGQWKSSFIIRWPAPGYDVRKKWKEIEVEDALPKGGRRLITVASDEKGTFIYVDGELARSYPNLDSNDVAHRIRASSFVLGNSPSGQGSWSGDVFGLAFYDAALNEKEALESFRQWTKGQKGKNPYPSETALYLFEEGGGNRVRNALGPGPSLSIPEHPAFQREVLGPPLINKYNKFSYIKDGIVNLVGFVPLGLFLSLWLLKTRPWPMGSIILIAVGVGGLMSLTIELAQVFIPVRDSSLMDLMCNTFGTLVGAGISVFVGSSKQMCHR
jgi:hypothetical protein